MLASRAAKPKLSLAINTASHAAQRPSLSLKSPVAFSAPRTPISPSPISPTARNTRLNQRGYSTVQQPSYAYANASRNKSILKRQGSGSSTASTSSRRGIQFIEEPTVYCVTPVDEADADRYYGAYVKMSKDERRWGRR